MSMRRCLVPHISPGSKFGAESRYAILRLYSFYVLLGLIFLAVCRIIGRANLRREASRLASAIAAEAE